MPSTACQADDAGQFGTRQWMSLLIRQCAVQRFTRMKLCDLILAKVAQIQWSVQLCLPIFSTPSEVITQATRTGVKYCQHQHQLHTMYSLSCVWQMSTWITTAKSYAFVIVTGASIFITLQLDLVVIIYRYFPADLWSTFHLFLQTSLHSTSLFDDR